MRALSLRRLVVTFAITAGLVAGAGACTPTAVPGCVVTARTPVINVAARTANIGGSFLNSAGQPCTTNLGPNDYYELDVKLFQTNDSTNLGVETANYIAYDLTPGAAFVQWNPSYTYTRTIVSAIFVSGGKSTVVASGYSAVVATF